MDNHERGIEKEPGRLDTPLSEWKGSHRGDPRKLPRVVQKLKTGRRLTAEEKAELLWRIYELDQAARGRRDLTRTLLLLLFLALAGLGTYLLVTQPWIAGGILDLMYPVNS